MVSRLFTLLTVGAIGLFSSDMMTSQTYASPVELTVNAQNEPMPIAIPFLIVIIRN